MNRMYSVESSTAEWATTTTSLLEKPFQPNPDHLDPHMEQLCKNIQKLSVTTSTLQDTSILVDNAMAKDNKIDMEDAADIENSASNSSAYQTATAATANTNGAVENSKTEEKKANGINDIGKKTAAFAAIRVVLFNESGADICTQICKFMN